jgi:diguanylate cyclase
MSVAYEPWIVALSILVAIQGTYVALGLAVKIGQLAGLARRLTLAAAAFTFAVAIWSMHFVGMLALRLPMRLDYLVLPTLLSMLVSVFVVGVAVFVASLVPVRRKALPLAAAIMGTGIATMHYIGMMALHGSVVMHHDPVYVLASFAVAVGASALGLRFAFVSRPALPLTLAAIVLGIAISGMHYVAMAGLTLEMPPDTAGSHAAQGGMALSPDLLAVVVALVAFGVSAVFLLTLVPDHAPLASPATGPPALPVPSHPTGPAPVLPAAAMPLEETAPPQSQPSATVLPVERNGTTHYLPIETVVFVRADTHYTSVFNGRTRLFCSLAIGDVEQRLDPARFLRVHRSYIVAVDRIASLQRAGDGGVAHFDTEDPASVPVSRARYSMLKARIEDRIRPVPIRQRS